MERSENMSRIRSKDTLPELKVRKALRMMGLNYRLHCNKYPGKPDIVIPRLKTAILVNGCFWHQHEGCKRSSVPKSNTSYWGPKLLLNTERDIIIQDKLRSCGMKVVVIWECETKKEEELIILLERKIYGN